MAHAQSGSLTWTTLLFYAGIAVISGLGGYWYAYATKKGEARAAQEDFERILEELSKTTNAVKKVETDIAHADWVQREWKRLRQVKLDELFQVSLSVRREVSDTEAAVLAGDPFSVNRDLLAEFTKLSNLYFPELRLYSGRVMAIFAELTASLVVARKQADQFGGADRPAFLAMLWLQTQKPIHAQLESALIEFLAVLTGFMHELAGAETTEPYNLPPASVCSDAA
ncbi:MAG TPA: hypothetical protein VLC08_16355 [Chitinolyticbacter sp.]|nr:hypothetical protein [Chitinolyticbacter sp.]